MIFAPQSGTVYSYTPAPWEQTTTWSVPACSCSTGAAWTWTSNSATGTMAVRYAYTCSADKYSVGLPKKPLTPEEQLRAIMRERASPLQPRHNPYAGKAPLRKPQDVREERARQTLRRVLGEERFESFLRSGYVTVRARSGKCYQLFPAHKMTCVYDKGRLVDRLCVVLQGEFPPTDSLIMRYLMVLNNERQFRQLAVRHDIGGIGSLAEPDRRPLQEIFRELKAVG